MQMEALEGVRVLQSVADVVRRKDFICCGGGKANRSTGRRTGRRTVERLRLSDRTTHLCHARVRSGSLNSFLLHAKMEQHWRVFLEGTVVLLERCRYLRLRVTAKEFNDAQKYGPQAELFFSSFCNTACEAKWARSSQQDM